MGKLKVPLKTELRIKGLIPDLVGLSKVFSKSSGLVLLVQTEFDGVKDSIGYETFERDYGEAIVTGSALQSALEADQSTFKKVSVNAITDQLNAFGFLADPDFEPVTPQSWSLVTSGGGSAGSGGSSNWNDRTRTSLGRVPQHTPMAEKTIRLVRTDESAWRIFKVLQLGVSWVNLNIVLEEIAYSENLKATRLHEIGLVDEKQLELFFKSANNARNIGEGIRHGRNRNKIVKKPLMNLTEAYGFVRQAVYDWYNRQP